jgi:hypothetical protein
VELVQLNPPVAVRGPHRCDVASDAVEPDEAVNRRSLDRRLAFQFQAKRDEERDRSLEVVDNDQNVVHSQHAHLPSMGVPMEAGLRLPNLCPRS